jgi:hypothetical protein
LHLLERFACIEHFESAWALFNTFYQLYFLEKGFAHILGIQNREAVTFTVAGGPPIRRSRRIFRAFQTPPVIDSMKGMNSLNQYAARGCNSRKAQLSRSSSIAVVIVIMAEHQQQPFHHVHHHSFYVLNKTGKSRRFTNICPCRSICTYLLPCRACK